MFVLSAEVGCFYSARVDDLFSSPITASTRYCAVYGQPIRHSASPAMHNPAMAELGLDWRYLAFEVAPDELGQAIASDYLLLRPDDSGMPILLGGCVCFPSSWAFEEKVGRPLDWIHAVVPTLNENLGEKARNFLTQLQPGQAWLRTNWGLTATADLNQHPGRNLPRLTAKTDPGNVWFRIERQALIAQPKSGGILFGIRLETHPLPTLKANNAARAGLLEALQTMPPEIAQYKNLTPARGNLLDYLQG